jgi:hypothetical protein
MQAIIQWIWECTAPYQNACVSDFSASFQDGVVLCDIVHFNNPSAIIHPSGLSKVQTAFFHSDFRQFQHEQNLEMAFKALELNWNIPRLLDASDFMVDPDEVSILMYLTCCFERIQS